VQEHLHLTRALLYRRFHCHVFEALFLHLPEEDRRFVTAGVGNGRFATGREQLRHEVSEGGGVLALVEDVCGEDEIEGTDTPYVRFAPVEDGDLWYQTQVRAGIVGSEVEGGLVVVRSKDICAAGEGEDGREPDAASELNGPQTSKVAFGEVTRQGEGAGPEFGPVGEPFVAVEVVLVDQVVRRDGMDDTVRAAPDTYRRFCQAGKATEMGAEIIQGSSAGGGLVGCAFLALGGGKRRYAVASEDVLQRLTRLVPYPARGAEGGVGYVADPACRAAGGTDLTVQDLDDVEDGDLLRGHREAVSSMSSAATLYHVRPPELAEDLLQEPLGDVLAARYLGHP
jgi:hypothetical protein